MKRFFNKIRHTDFRYLAIIGPLGTAVYWGLTLVDGINWTTHNFFILRQSYLVEVGPCSTDTIGILFWFS